MSTDNPVAALNSRPGQTKTVPTPGEIPASEETRKRALARLPERYLDRLLARRSSFGSVVDACCQATDYCTHQLRLAPAGAAPRR